MHEVPESMTQRADHAVAGQLAPHRGDRDEPVVLVKVADGMRGPIDRSVVRRQRPAELEQGDDLAGERSEGELLAFGEVPGMCVDDKEAAEDVTVTCGQRRASVKANMGRPGDSGEPAEVLVVAGVSDEEPPVSQVVCCEELRAGALPEVPPSQRLEPDTLGINKADACDRAARDCSGYLCQVVEVALPRSVEDDIPG